LVFGAGRLTELFAAAASVTFDAAMQAGQSIEPLVYCSDVLRHPHCFVARALHTGEALYVIGNDALPEA
jgi:hypothetical protein